MVTIKYDGNHIGGLLGEKNGKNDDFGNCYYNGTINSEIGDFGHVRVHISAIDGRIFIEERDEDNNMTEYSLFELSQRNKS